MKEKKDCKIVQDLLPNYIERLTNEETNQYIEEHLKECDECKSILERMQKDLKIDDQKREKREVKYIKKYSNKLRILKIIIFIIIAAFVITTGKKMMIISNLSRKADSYVMSNNYHEESTTYAGDNLINIDVYYKDGKSVTIMHRITKNETNKITIYSNGEKKNTYWETGDKKTAKLNEEKGIEFRISNYIETNNILELLIASITTNIKSVECNGKECYLLSGFISSSLLTGGNDIVYIEKETGLVIRSSLGNIKNEVTGRNTDQIRDVNYEFGTVMDDIFEEPDINEYQVQE